jgi:hypothetical protein
MLPVFILGRTKSIQATEITKMIYFYTKNRQTNDAMFYVY